MESTTIDHASPAPEADDLLERALAAEELARAYELAMQDADLEAAGVERADVVAAGGAPVVVTDAIAALLASGVSTHEVRVRLMRAGLATATRPETLAAPTRTGATPEPALALALEHGIQWAVYEAASTSAPTFPNDSFLPVQGLGEMTGDVDVVNAIAVPVMVAIDLILWIVSCPDEDVPGRVRQYVREMHGIGAPHADRAMDDLLHALDAKGA